MQRSLSCLSSQSLPACGFILHFTSRFLISFPRVIRAPRKEYLIGVAKGVCSVSLNSRRNYRGSRDENVMVKQRIGERPRIPTRYPYIALNQKIIDFGKERKWREILQLVEKEKNQFNNVNWATAFSQLGKIRELDRNDPLLVFFLKAYADRLEKRGLKWAGIREVANVVYNIGKMQLKNPATKSIMMFVSKEEIARKIVEEGFPREVTFIAWAFAKLGIPSPNFFAEINKNADWLVTSGSSKEVAAAAWAFATLNDSSPKFFIEIETRAEWLLIDTEPREIANLAWSFAKLDIRATKFFAEIDTDLLVTTGNTQDVANTAWAFAKLDIKSPELFAAIETRADWLVTNGNAQDFANIAWACAKLDVESPDFFAAIETRADWLVENGTAQDLANTAWACATLDVKNSPKLFTEIEKRCDWLVWKGKPQDVAHTLWAASHLQYHLPKLMAQTNSRGAWLAKEGRTRDISNIAIAFANYGYDAALFFTAVTKNVSKLINDGNPQYIIDVLYSMAIVDLGKKHSDAFCQLWNAAINLDTAILSDQALRRLGLVFAFWTANGMELQQPSAFLFQMIGAVATPDSTKSKYQREVAEILGQLGLDYEEKVSPASEGSKIESGVLSIDFACKNQMLAIEYDDESCFLRETDTGKVTQRENGATKAKRRFLQQMGWNVINIGYQDWIDAEMKNCRLEFLSEKVDEGEMANTRNNN